MKESRNKVRICLAYTFKKIKKKKLQKDVCFGDFNKGFQQCLTLTSDTHELQRVAVA